LFCVIFTSGEVCHQILRVVPRCTTRGVGKILIIGAVGAD
jgi:hypothetical protein